MSIKKKQIRNSFNCACLKRDNYRCVLCGEKANHDNWREILDVHHITNREDLPNGGFVLENGISLCKIKNNCHLVAEQFHVSGQCPDGHHPNELYQNIHSSYEKAVKASLLLSGPLDLTSIWDRLSIGSISRHHQDAGRGTFAGVPYVFEASENSWKFQIGKYFKWEKSGIFQSGQSVESISRAIQDCVYDWSNLD